MSKHQRLVKALQYFETFYPITKTDAYGKIIVSAYRKKCEECEQWGKRYNVQSKDAHYYFEQAMLLKTKYNRLLEVAEEMKYCYHSILINNLLPQYDDKMTITLKQIEEIIK